MARFMPSVAVDDAVLPVTLAITVRRTRAPELVALVVYGQALEDASLQRCLLFCLR